jgi:hypothetical protein
MGEMRVFRFFLFAFFFSAFFFRLEALTLEEKFTQATAGDFIVTAQESNYSLLFIRSITAETLLLEEISIPEHQIDTKKIGWHDWIAKKAPGHTSWTLYEIDRKSGELIECFSYSKNGWIYLDASEQFLTRLLSLPLNTVYEKERKRIGPPPGNGEEDRRGVWNPPLVVEGKKIGKASFEVFKARWPEDGTRLSRCFIELYFNKEESSFPFPYWVEVQSPHYVFKMRTIDSGHNLFSPMTGGMPHRPPKILGLAQEGIEAWTLPIQTPPYFEKLHLFALDSSSDTKRMIPISFRLQQTPDSEKKVLVIPSSDLKQLLKSEHRYRWVLIPEGSSDIYVESEETFTYTSID